MIFALDLLLCAVSMVLLVPVCVLLLQTLAAMPRRAKRDDAGHRRPAVAILVPAHNEGQGIRDTLVSIAPQLIEGDRLLVVADNCTDDTAEVARKWGAEVIERTDAERRGKGYALDFGVRHLQQSPPEVVIIVDADCVVETGAVDRLARQAALRARPIQALYLMRSPVGAGLKTRVAEFAWVVKNCVRPLGFYRMGLPCQLMGTGMAFPWRLLSSAHLASGHIVEDMKLGIELAAAGAAPVFCPDALVVSYFPGSAEGSQTQRTRWEHGHMDTIVHEVPRLCLDALKHGNLDLFMLALDLSVPPLALLTLVVFALNAAATVFLLLTSYSMPFYLAAAALSALVFAIGLAWLRYGRSVISLSSLLLAFVYIFWKLPLYLKFFGRRQVEWVRSKRDADS